MSEPSSQADIDKAVAEAVSLADIKAQIAALGLHVLWLTRAVVFLALLELAAHGVQISPDVVKAIGAMMTGAP